MRTTIIKNGRAVLPDKVVKADIVVRGDRIEAILTESQEQATASNENHQLQSLSGDAVTVIDAENRYILPGLVDIHCDAIEKEVQPRPNTLFPLQMALIEFERKLPVHGITSMYHSLSLGVGLSLRGDHLLTQMVELIHAYKQRRAMIRHGIHLRYEVSHLAGIPVVERYVQEGKIDYLSFMDHSPGQGQYKAPGSFESYVMKNQAVNREEVQQIVEELLTRQQLVDWNHLERLGKLAAQKGISVASHDDDSPERVDHFLGFGVNISEFPMNLQTAEHAMRKGLHVCVGAPNVVRGGSHDKNLSAIAAIGAGAANILCSDYHPASLLAAVFKLSGLYDSSGLTQGLPEAVAMASLNPAKALGVDKQLGSIEIGKKSDLIIVDTFDGYPMVSTALVNGTIVYESSAYYPLHETN
ncbi:alpha-D-ribose 1-methylphosphonate 5-triphosphate diphosphatase [Paenibacillus sp. GCM10012307]|uniref:Alpha-D-ribose 1-methylphosphonate 5-triphosphate diphosphatase n=1 Tax=Paenibacillus roseus TaxID=2798579 RepID=A0A934MRI5_9BACL|nr:alpha-D-ribose 1-methylphosphonate 5-triphosphate diphosphatase [Paenibacillus roseus]MBJ6362379.1 alpha-D-ribose 1-methylphosphonate 5-triphosphate diphosphatase [Paenibacillus roseus]